MTLRSGGVGGGMPPTRTCGESGLERLQAGPCPKAFLRSTQEAEGLEKPGPISPRFARDGATRNAGRTYFLPVTVKWARRFFCQHSSLDCVQTGTSLPYETVFSRSAVTPRETR
jgi:hypothetical protein